MVFGEAQPKNKMEIFEIGIYVFELSVIAAIVYAMIACISYMIETSYVIDGTNFML